MKAGAAILEVFHRAAGQFVGVDELQRSVADASASAGPQLKRQVQEELAELQQLGYTIESHPHFGYRLLGTPDRLTADEIKAQLSSTGGVSRPGLHRRTVPGHGGDAAPTGRLIGSEILVFEETASTNDVVEQLAKAGAGEGLVVFAESQTKGRGRHGRMWMSPRGKGLWFSVLLRPNLPPPATSRITVAASVAVARAIRQSCGLDARIKWPNDVIVSGKKLAGILVEVKSGIALQDDGFDGKGVPACEPSTRGVDSFRMTRRNLPHWQNPGHAYFVTFRVRKGGLLAEEMRDIVLQACRHWHGQRYHLYAVTVMPDHVHLLLWPQPLEATGVPVAQASLPVGSCPVREERFHSLSDILHSLKSFTAREIQRRYGWRGSVWMDESFDRVVRDEAEFMEKWNYIAQNAAKKGLAATADDYRWFWFAPEHLGAESRKRPQAGTPVPPTPSVLPLQAGKIVALNDYLVLGIGIDVNCAAKDFSPEVAKIATSLQIETGQTHDRAALAAAVLRALDRCYAAVPEDFDTIIEEWAQLSTTLGKQIVVTMGTRRIEGHVQALDSDGALLVRRDSGQIERILGGDVVVERT